MKKYFVAATVGVSAALSVSTAYSATGQQELLLSGAVESVDRATNTVIVLGHRLAIRDSSRILPGHRVNVFGKIGTDGVTKAEFVQDSNAYAASGDAVVVTGRVSAADYASGRVMIDGASVDYTALLSRSSFRVPMVGSAVRVAGTQPSGKGVILASEVVAAVGVSGSSQAVGVSGSSQAVGVSGSSQAVGVSGSSFTPKALGVSGSSFVTR